MGDADENETPAERRASMSWAQRLKRVFNIDIAICVELLRQYPLFADLDDASLRQLAGNLQTRYVNENTVIVNKDRVEKKVYFIASGAVEVESAGRLSRLGLGEMFGAMTFLPGRYRRVRVRTLILSTLLVLDEVRFRHLLERGPRPRQVVNDTVAIRH